MLADEARTAAVDDGSGARGSTGSGKVGAAGRTIEAPVERRSGLKAEPNRRPDPEPRPSHPPSRNDPIKPDKRPKEPSDRKTDSTLSHPILKSRRFNGYAAS
jgi:hypothetical protein